MKPPPQPKLLPHAAKLFAMGCLVTGGLGLLGQQATNKIGDTLAELLLFHGRPAAEWNEIQPVVCTPWLRDVGYVGAPLTCDAALAKPGVHETALTPSGRRAHYVIYSGGSGLRNAPSNSEQPIWIHFHGLGSNYLHGTRYLDIAERRGFRLVSAEYVNHGLSDHDGKGAAYGCKERDDVVAVVRAVLARFPKGEVLITATSMGTMAVALAEAQLTTSDREGRIVALALENPPTSVRDLASTVGVGAKLPRVLIDLALKHAAERSGYDFEECSPLRAYPRFRHPTLVQHAKTDELTPHTMGEHVQAALPESIPSQIVIYPTGSHSAVWNAQPEQFEQDLFDFFERGRQWRKAQRPRAALLGSETPPN